MQHCIFPRTFLADALYCAHFAVLLHRIGTPLFYRQYFDILAEGLPRCRRWRPPENEAARLGFFPARKPRCRPAHAGRKPATECVAPTCPACVSFGSCASKDHARVVSQSHLRVLAKAFSSLESKEALELKNALVVLSKIVHVFPAIHRGQGPGAQGGDAEGEGGT